MSQPTLPPNGIRIRVDRVSDSQGETAEYKVTTRTADVENTQLIVLGQETPTALDHVPEWALRSALSLVKGLTRSHERTGVWPRKLQRWLEQRG